MKNSMRAPRNAERQRRIGGNSVALPDIGFSKDTRVARLNFGRDRCRGRHSHSRRVHVAVAETRMTRPQADIHPEPDSLELQFSTKP